MPPVPMVTIHVDKRDASIHGMRRQRCHQARKIRAPNQARLMVITEDAVATTDFFHA